MHPLILFFLLFPVVAEAYIGPGLGTGTIGAVLGILLSLVLLILALIWYPIKRLIKKWKNRNAENV
jgi:hypothetical protein